MLQVHNRYRSSMPSGEDRVVDEEHAALGAAGYVVERFERSSDDIAGRSVIGKALVPGQVVWSERARRSLGRAVRAFQPDVVHVHNTFPLLGASVLYACRSERVPVVLTVHNYRLECPSGDFFRDGAVCHDCQGRVPVAALRHRCYRDSRLATVPIAAGIVAHGRAWRSMVSAYVFLSSAQRELIGRRLPRERLFVKPNFVPEPSLAPGSPRHRGAVVYAGRLSVSKGLPLLMDAWDRYRAGGGSLRLVVAGRGPLEDRVAAWAAERPSVEWVGLLDRTACMSLVAGAKAIVVPSAWEETFGLVVIEAMAVGVPALAPAHGSFPELIRPGKDGQLFEPGSAPALAAALTDLESRPEHYAALGTAARRTYEERFGSRANVEQLSKIYGFAVAHPAANRG